jgi:hypothetical protein
MLSVARDNLKGKKPRTRKPIHFRPYKNYLVPYVVLNESSGKPLPINRVIVGPSTEVERRRDSVEVLLNENGYDVEVVVSDIPFA